MTYAGNRTASVRQKALTLSSLPFIRAGEAELAVLEAYAADGGLLVLTDSARRLKCGYILEENEDWSDANAQATRFGVTYQAGLRAVEVAGVEGTAPCSRARGSWP